MSMGIFTCRNYIVLFALFSPLTVQAAATECGNWSSLHPEWIWCDDFESDAQLNTDYFEVDRAGGRFGVSTDDAFGGSASLKGVFIPTTKNAGNIKFSFGRTPVAPSRNLNQDFQDIYWRFYMKVESSWTGNPAKTTRVMIFSGSDWSQAAIGHLWNDNSLGLALDPASGVSAGPGSTQVNTSGYNDFNNLRWLGILNGNTQVYSPGNTGKWLCIETRVKLNTPGLSDGAFQFWIDDALEAERHDLNWRSSYQAYGLNAIFIENYSKGNLTQQQARYFDNFVVSTSKIGCNSGRLAPPMPPRNITSNTLFDYLSAGFTPVVLNF